MKIWSQGSLPWRTWDKWGGEGGSDSQENKTFRFSKDSTNPYWAPTLWLDYSMPWKYRALNIIFRFLLSWSLFVGRSAKLE